MSTRSTAKQNVIGKLQRLSAGLRKLLGGQTIVLAGKSVKVDDLLKVFDAYIAQLATTDQAHSDWLTQVAVTRAMENGQVNPQVASLEDYLRSFYGPTSQTLTSFGLAPRKARARTAKTNIEAAEKNAATRVARHTLGPRQKAAIHGTEPAETTPPTTPTPDAPKRNT
jgi:hypothetical protein